ncbi:MAG: hypothetical protein ACR2KZ_10380 [Segetibacter sp.]
MVECWSADAEAGKKEQYHDELRTVLNLKPDARIIEISHHLSHLYSCYNQLPFMRQLINIINNL